MRTTKTLVAMALLLVVAVFIVGCGAPEPQVEDSTESLPTETDQAAADTSVDVEDVAADIADLDSLEEDLDLGDLESLDEDLAALE
jgi:PBP1b-binding outer membrane lipoprotein LpoB